METDRRKDRHPEDREATDAASAESYERPRLERLGKVEEVTRGDAAGGTDVAGLSL